MAKRNLLHVGEHLEFVELIFDEIIERDGAIDRNRLPGNPIEVVCLSRPGELVLG